jgi:hypothetical protein
MQVWCDQELIRGGFGFDCFWGRSESGGGDVGKVFWWFLVGFLVTVWVMLE